MADNFGESALLRATVSEICRNAEGVDDDNVTIAPDETFIPPISGHHHVVVSPGYRRPGPRHAKSGHVRDDIHGILIHCIIRHQNLPLDRKSKRYITYSESLDEFMDDIRGVIDWNYTLITDANTLITEKTGSSEGFIYPLVWEGDDPTPRPAMAELFHAGRSAQAGQAMGLIRTMRFGGANRIQTISTDY